MSTSERLFNLVLGALALALVGAVAFGIGYWIYIWFGGMEDVLNAWWGFPAWLTILAVLIVCWLVRPAMLLLALVGFFGTYFTLGWPFWKSLVVYLPTFAFLFASVISVTVIAIFAGIAQLLSNRKYRR